MSWFQKSRYGWVKYSLETIIIATHFLVLQLAFWSRNSLFDLATRFSDLQLAFLTRNSLFWLATRFSDSTFQWSYKIWSLRFTKPFAHFASLVTYSNENNILRSLSLSLFCISVCISDLVFLNGQTLQKADGRRDLENIIWQSANLTGNM